MDAPSVKIIDEKITSANFAKKILEPNVPVIVKGAIADWEFFKIAKVSDEAAFEYLNSTALNKSAKIIVGEPNISGSFFYKDDVRKRNFMQGQAEISTALARLKEQFTSENPFSVYLQSLSIEDYFPKLLAQTKLEFLDKGVLPKIWIGNALKVQTHFDLAHNFACLVCGKRRFTIFEPGQIENMYPAPFEHALSGTPVSMVNLENPNLNNYPNYAKAMETAQIADLEAGDGLFLPFGYWHHVQSFNRFNILVNYWWNDTMAASLKPYDALLYSMLNLKGMDKAQLDFWRNFFDYFVFKLHGEPMEHLPKDQQGIMGEILNGDDELVKSMLLQKLNNNLQ